MALTIYCDTAFDGEAAELLRAGLARHRVITAANPQTSNLAPGSADPAITDADVVFGQPDRGAIAMATALRWVHLTSAGYTRYDTTEMRAMLRERRIALTTSSHVYADPCAEHVLAMMLGMTRGLPDALDAQRAAPPSWESARRRSRARVLRGQTVLLLGYGAIGRRLAELLAPFEPRLLALRRAPGAAAEREGRIEILSHATLDGALSVADHIVDVLPENDQTRGLLSRERLALLKTTAFVYNVGRGATIDQDALVDALRAGRLGGAYLDVTTPEPLPPDDPLWSTPHGYVTPHMAGGRDTEHVELVRHFLDNLARFEAGEPMIDRVV